MSGRRFCVCFLSLLAGSNILLGQIDPIPNLKVQPLPLPGGDVVPGFGLVHSFIPGPSGQTPPFDPIGADPHVLTNFRGIMAMGYTLGTATDNKGNSYAVLTDVRVYRGEYLGGRSPDPNNSGGYTASAPSRGTFVEI
jgi:hypothetical protein